MYTLGIIKPGAFREGHGGKMIDAILLSGFQIEGMKLIHLSYEDGEKFYAVHKERPFFQELCNYISSGPVIVLALKKQDAVEDFRTLIGATDPAEALPHTLRAQYGKDIGDNAIHGSDSSENGLKEIAFFFAGRELVG